MNKPFETPVKYGKNETSRSDVGASSPALDIGNLIGGYVMPVKGNITVSGDSASGDTYIPAKTPLTHAIIKDLLDYDPDTGFLYWRPRPRKYSSSEQAHNAVNSNIAGKRAFTAVNTGGYYQGAILRNQCTAHRVIWNWMTGDFPDGCIDHIDRDPLNNKWENLRLCTRGQNQANRKSYSNSSSKYLGVTKKPRKKFDRWTASITRNYQTFRLGYFKSEIEAAKAYDAAAIEMHGEFANTNFPQGIRGPQA
ncbi:HNH endonuclease [Rhodobacteraceae bacterium R_SAG2]|nr:HNH endonuclease [Rhodobacteraceae bacterium R_SAG2]